MEEFSTIDEFRRVLDEDLRRGLVRSLEDYIALRPELSDAIVEAFEERFGSAPTRGPIQAATVDDLVGLSVGAERYRLRSKLGSGGQATVYLAEDRSLGRRVAVKVFARAGILPARQRERIRREGLIASRLDHPGICAVYDTGEEHGLAYLVMRLVEGRTLSSLIRQRAEAKSDERPSLFHDFESERGTVSEGGSSGNLRRSRPHDEIVVILKIIARAARALHVAHEAGIVHRDVKPNNIVIGPDLEPVILDFGMAQDEDLADDQLTLSGEIFGTPSYMAPEQISGRRVLIDRRTDVYALGATLYECLTLRRPFSAPTREQLFGQILNREPIAARALNPQISPDLAVILDTAMAKEPNRRYQTALDLAEEIDRLLAGKPILARPLGPFGRFARWYRRNPATASAVAAAFLILVLATIGAGKLARDARRERDRADARTLEYERLADARRLAELEAETERLWPIGPQRRAAMRSWIDRAQALVAGRASHAEALDRLSAAARPRPRAERGLAETPAADRSPSPRPEEIRFDRAEDAWRYDQLKELVAGLDRLATSVSRGIPAIESRLELAESLERRSLVDAAEAWEACRARVAASTLYGGLDLRPQLGLVPLGPNAAGYEEFRHLVSDARPDDAAPRAAGIAAEDGIVLVLLPGGRGIELGSPSDEAGRRPDERSRRVDFAPFMISKYEVTQAQWQRVMAENPAQDGAGDAERSLRPVENVSARDCDRFVLIAGLALPSEDQWEYACRGGTRSAYWWGDDAERADELATVGDRDLGSTTLQRSHVAVAKSGVNPFGLFGLHGNVAEWTADAYAQDFTGGGRALDSAQRSYRDGNFLLPAVFGRAAARHKADPDLRVKTLGLRPARALEKR